VNSTIELAGPEPIRMDELVRRFLSAKRDARKVTTDAHARFFGTAVNDQSLTPGDNPRIGPTRFEWLSRSMTRNDWSFHRLRHRVRRRTVARHGPLPTETSAPKSYKIIAMSLYSDQADALDEAVRELANAGYPKASRSLIVQAAVERLREELGGRTQEEVLRYFGERHLRRPLRALKSRQQAASDSRQLPLPLSQEA
jgi:hypothetical protein